MVISDANEVFRKRTDTSSSFLRIFHKRCNDDEEQQTWQNETWEKGAKLQTSFIAFFMCQSHTLFCYNILLLLDSTHALLLFKKSAFSTKSHRPSDKPKVPFFPLLPTFLYFLKRPSTFELLRVGGFYVGLLVGLLQIFSSFDLFTYASSVRKPFSYWVSFIFKLQFFSGIMEDFDEILMTIFLFLGLPK